MHQFVYRKPSEVRSDPGWNRKLFFTIDTRCNTA